MQPKTVRRWLHRVNRLRLDGLEGLGGQSRKRRHVAVPADVAADLGVIEPALLLRRLEAFLHCPSAAGDADQFVQVGASRAVGDVVGDLLGPADATAGENPVLAVLAVPGPHLDAGPVVDPPAVGPFTAGTALPLLPRQAGNRSGQGGREPSG